MYEDVLQWLYSVEKRNELEMKVTCAPHYYRIVKEKGDTPKSAGCLAGKSFLFISHRGIAQPCGYLEMASGDVRKRRGAKGVGEPPRSSMHSGICATTKASADPASI